MSIKKEIIKLAKPIYNSRKEQTLLELVQNWAGPVEEEYFQGDKNI